MEHERTTQIIVSSDISEENGQNVPVYRVIVRVSAQKNGQPFSEWKALVREPGGMAATPYKGPGEEFEVYTSSNIVWQVVFKGTTTPIAAIWQGYFKVQAENFVFVLT